MCADFVKPPEPIYWRFVGYGSPVTVGIITPIVAGEEWYQEFVKGSRLLWVTYVNRTARDRILYVGSGGPRRPFVRHHLNSGGSIDAPSQELFQPGDEDLFIEVLAVANSRFFAKILESLICELFPAPLNKVRQILPTGRHLFERNEAVKFWNRNYAKRFGTEAPWPYPWGEKI